MKKTLHITVIFLVFVFAARLHAVSLMTSNDVATVLAQALTRANHFVANGTATRSNAVVAVVDREGFVLGVWSIYPLDTNLLTDTLDIIDAITKAGSAAFLSSDQHAFSSRTAGFIVQQHFPAGIRNTPTGPLVGVNFSNMSFTDVNRFKNPHSGYVANGLSGVNGGRITPTMPIDLSAISGLAGSPGGVPLYKDGKLIGGVGAVVTTTGNGPIPALADIQMQAKQKPDVDEDVALAGQKGFEPAKNIFGSRVFVAGIRLAYIKSKTHLDVVAPLGSIGAVVAPYEITASPDVHYTKLNILNPDDPDTNHMGEIRADIIGDPLATNADPNISMINGEMRLNADDVYGILSNAAYRASITRAGIRLPRGVPMQIFISVVNNPNQPGVAPALLGTYRTPEATIFSWDVCVQKARTAVFFSDTNRAFSSRTVGFLAQSLYPPGIAKTSPGPFLGLQEKFSIIPLGVENPLNGVVFLPFNPPPTEPNANLPNGITIFPGGFPLYRNGVLIGAIGVSGDGIDQDDLASASGTIDFLPPNEIRADHMRFRGARLPYAKFPRNPSL